MTASLDRCACCLKSRRGALSKTSEGRNCTREPNQSVEPRGPRLPRSPVGCRVASPRSQTQVCISRRQRTACHAPSIHDRSDRKARHTTNSRADIMHNSHPLGPPPSCYFTLPVSTSHYSDETPQTSPYSEYMSATWASPSNPLLAHRPLPMANLGIDASRFLQLQTQAAHRPSSQPLQPASSPSPSNSDSSMSSKRGSISMSPAAALCCCRCRRESHGHSSGMFQFGTNLYYCSHCARMVGYSAG